MLAALSLGDCELSVLLCGELVMRELNRTHRNIDRPTDVLAFAMTEGRRMPSALPALLGDIVISLPTAARQALASGKDMPAEVTFLLAHGLLHLIGFDHVTAPQERKMTAHTEKLVIAALGRGVEAVDSLGMIVPKRLRSAQTVTGRRSTSR